MRAGRNQRLPFDLGGLFIEKFPGGLDKFGLEEEVERGERLGFRSGGRALVSDRSRRRDATGPVMHGHVGNVSRITQHDGRHVPADLADVVTAAAEGIFRWLQSAGFRRETIVGHSQCFLGGTREGVVRRGPRGHAHALDVLLHRLGDGLVEETRPVAGEHVFRHSRVGHQRRTLGYAAGGFMEIADALIGTLAEVIPHCRRCRHDIGLDATVDDHVVRALVGWQVLSPEIPTDIHQFHASRALRPSQGETPAWAPLPWKVNCVETMPTPYCPYDTLKLLETWQPSTTSTSLNRPAWTMKVRLAPSSSATPGYSADGAGELVLVDELLQRDRRGDDHRRAGVVAFAVAGRAGHLRLLVGHAGFLREAGQSVQVRHQRDHGRPRAILATKAVGIPATPRVT